ncbi:hypothetical protein PIB30_028817 [Stylosanthes scabra]|uniref:Uncharacterized protein n=1 Tax=Stylosanthes scabra TaxID=79078 RepID=A0ABU6TAV6_9FABA|nr:hypothetical protein [Stylosanthes scabra]
MPLQTLHCSSAPILSHFSSEEQITELSLSALTPLTVHRITPLAFRGATALHPALAEPKPPPLPVWSVGASQRLL